MNQINSAFLGKCRKIGYRSLHDLLSFVKNPDEQVLNHPGGIMLEFWRLSSGEQENTIHAGLLETLPNVLCFSENEGWKIREVCMTLLSNGAGLSTWSHRISPRWNHLLYFSNDLDAVNFMMVA